MAYLPQELIFNYLKSDTQFVYPRADLSTHALINIGYLHHLIHAGSHYLICNFLTLNSGSSANFIVITPNTTKLLHMTFQVLSTSRMLFRIYEGAIITQTGSKVAPINNDRNSTNTSSALVYKNSTITDSGSLVYAKSSGLLGINQNTPGIAGSLKRLRLHILKTNTTYIFNIKSAHDANIISYCGNWYLHTPKN